jgi:hypothetical protein
MRTVQIQDIYLGLVVISIPAISHCYFDHMVNKVKIVLTSGSSFTTTEYTLEMLIT